MRCVRHLWLQNVKLFLRESLGSLQSEVGMPLPLVRGAEKARTLSPCDIDVSRWRPAPAVSPAGLIAVSPVRTASM
jgi:hypothetical protein